MNLLLLLALKIQDPDGSGSIEITPPGGAPIGGITHKGNTTLQLIIQKGVTIIIIIAITLALFFLIWGGIQWIMSAGDKHKVEQARSRIIYAIIGLLVIFFSYFIVKLIGSLFGIDLFCPTSVCR